MIFLDVLIKPVLVDPTAMTSFELIKLQSRFFKMATPIEILQEFSLIFYLIFTVEQNFTFRTKTSFERPPLDDMDLPKKAQTDWSDILRENVRLVTFRRYRRTQIGPI